MKRLPLAALAAFAGCYHHVEGSPDAIELPDGGPCLGGMYGSGLLRVCLDTTPPPGATISQLQEDTDRGMPMPCTVIAHPAIGPEVCVIAAQAITISGPVRAVGTRPLAFLGVDSLLISSGGSIDVSSATGGSAGAGAPRSCLGGRGMNGGGVTSPISAGGGAGGAYGGPGGGGGSGDLGVGASATAPVALTAVIGGCPGGSGGSSSTNAGGAGSIGGGAIYLLSRGTISIAGHINASGAGGTSAAPQAGGAGGGAGGLIALDGASYLIASATMFAIGGSGSTGGGAQATGAAGMTATTPTDTMTPTPPSGGGNGGPGTGVDGMAGTNGNRDLATSRYGGGGGGGGGGGYIVAKNAPANSPSTIVPPIAEMP